MSSVVWRGDKIIQRCSGKEENLGLVTTQRDGKATLWLRVVDYPSLADARREAAGHPVLTSAHLEGVARLSR